MEHYEIKNFIDLQRNIDRLYHENLKNIDLFKTDDHFVDFVVYETIKDVDLFDFYKKNYNLIELILKRDKQDAELFNSNILTIKQNIYNFIKNKAGNYIWTYHNYKNTDDYTKQVNKVCFYEVINNNDEECFQ